MTAVRQPRVSFVVLSYNFARYLGECVESILAQEGDHDLEVIVVDDASTDATESVLSTFRDPRVRILRHPRNRGHAATVADGLASARGDFVVRVDGDDRYRPRFLSETLPQFERFPEVGLVYCDAALIDERGRLTEERSDRVHGGKDFKGDEFLALLEKNFICSPTVIARREAWLAALPVPPHLAFHDWYFTVAMARRFEFYYVNRVLAEYRVHAANLHTAIARDRREEASILWLLDRVFDEPEPCSAREARKRKARRRIYGAHFKTIADKYFGFGMSADAQRCYLQAVRQRPEYLLDPGVVRRLAGTLIGRERYEAAKAVFKSAARSVRTAT